jgi:hypothetical protein
MRVPRWKHNAVALAQSPSVQTFDTQQVFIIEAVISAAVFCPIRD